MIEPLASLIRKIVIAKAEGFVTDIEKDTIANNNFRKVLYTGKNSQLVLMSLELGMDIGEEVHPDVDQFFRVEKGKGKAVINGVEKPLKDGSAIVVPAGAKHNIINESDKEPLKLYSIYSPPHHLDQVIHKNKEDAEKAEKDKSDVYKGETTEKSTKEAYKTKTKEVDIGGKKIKVKLWTTDSGRLVDQKSD